MKLWIRKLPIYVLCILLLCAQPAWAAKKAPAFKLKTWNGGKIALTDLKSKVVYVDFWASWCVPCRKSFPWLNDMRKKYRKKGLRIVAINLDTERSSVEKFLKRYPANFNIALNPEGSIAEKYNVKGMPSAYLIDRQGRIRKTHIGFRESDKEKLEQEIVKLLKSK